MKRKKTRQKSAPPPPPRPLKKLSAEAMGKLGASSQALQMASMRHELAATQHALLVRTLERDYEFVMANVQIQPDGTIMDISKANRPRPTPPQALENIRKQGQPAPAPEEKPDQPEKEADGATPPAPGLELVGG
jgi:hypothetical protein